jgi:toxin ParE1/3/4
MSIRRYGVSRLAIADLDQIWLHVAQRASVQTADRLIDDITSRFSMLAGAPEAGATRDDIGPGVRMFPVKPYIIYYRKARGCIEIARIIHGRRDQVNAWSGQ